jgi:hypothetical protein
LAKEAEKLCGVTEEEVKILGELAIAMEATVDGQPPLLGSTASLVRLDKTMVAQ